jgi:hypothetical protein
MTTYPLSEPATIYASENQRDILGKGTLAECAAMFRGLLSENQSSATIKMDDLDLTYGRAELDELVRFLEQEDEGLSNKDIADIAGSIK